MSFISGSPAQGGYFYGRRREIDAILAQRHSWVFGLRRMGKTSLLHRVKEKALEQGQAAFFFDLTFLRGSGNSVTPEQFFDRFFLSHHRGGGPFAKYLLSLSDFSNVPPVDRFVRLAEAIRAHSRELFFLWDEAEQLLDIEQTTPGFLEQLFVCLSAVDGLQIVVSAGPKISQFLDFSIGVRSFLEHFSWVPLAGLDHADAIELARCKQTGGWRSPLPEGIIYAAVNWSGGHPYILQELCSLLASLTNFDGAVATFAILQECQHWIMVNPIITSLIRQDFLCLGDLERRVLAMLCEKGSVLNNAEAAKAVGCEVKALGRVAATLKSYGYAYLTESIQLRFNFLNSFTLADEFSKEQAGLPKLDLNPIKPLIANPLSAISSKPCVFVSYSRNDSEYFEELKKPLLLLANQLMLEIWDDGRIDPGSVWVNEVESALERSSAAVLLVSNDFLSSRFMTDLGLPRILHKWQSKTFLILIIYIRHSVVEDLFYLVGGKKIALTDIQALNTKDRPLSKLRRHERDKELIRIAQLIIKTLKQ